MKKQIAVIILVILACSSLSYSQFQKNSAPTDPVKFPKLKSIPSTGASMGFNLGLGSIEGEVAFAIGAFAELKSTGFAFVPQANYWKANEQNNFEIAGLARFYLGEKPVVPYLDGGIGVNFYNSDKDDFTKMSILAGGGVELMNVSSSFSVLLDGKYKLIVNDKGNLSCFIFTAGMKFPFR